MYNKWIFEDFCSIYCLFNKMEHLPGFLQHLVGGGFTKIFTGLN